VKFVLTIAGHDPSNGAGITKDLEVFASFGLHGLSIPTCLVVQGPKGVSGATAISDDVFVQMLNRVGQDFALAGVKIGVLPEAYHADRIVEFLPSLKDAFIVLDPIGSAKNGVRLTSDEAQSVVKEKLLRHLTCITPNLDETSELAGSEVHDIAGMEWAALGLAGKGAKSVVIKGGHLAGEPTDLLFDGSQLMRYEKKRIDRNVHGTGCLFSSTLLSFLVLDYPIREAFCATEHVMERLLEESVQPLGGGYFYASIASLALRGGERWWESITRAICKGMSAKH